MAVKKGKDPTLEEQYMSTRPTVVSTRMRCSYTTPPNTRGDLSAHKIINYNDLWIVDTPVFIPPVHLTP